MRVNRAEGEAMRTKALDGLLAQLSALSGAQLAVGPRGAVPLFAADGPGTAEHVLADGRVLRVSRAATAVDAPPLAHVVTAAAAVLEQLFAADGEVQALSDELLERYEEVTLLHELADALVAVFDEADACATVLHRARLAIDARYGEVFLSDADGGLQAASPPPPAHALPPPDVQDQAEAALRVAHAARGRTTPLLLNRGDLHQGVALAEPALCVPLRASAARSGQSDELGVLVLLGRAADRFTAGEAALGVTVGRQLATVLENDRLLLQLREKERIEREVEVAADIQRQLLPARSPLLPGATLAAVCLPAERVGGDYYDFVVTDDAVTVVVADVSGHGIGPGLMMAMTRSALRHELQSGASLSQAMAATNKMMWDDLLATGLFITVFGIHYEFATGKTRFVNGGHHPALLRRADGTVEPLDGDGYPLGLLPDATFEEPSVVVEPGDSVVLFTDGIVEERAPSGEMFGTHRLVRLLCDTAGPASDAILEALQVWRDGGPQLDDVTLVELCTEAEPS